MFPDLFFMHFILQLQYLLSVKAKRRSLRLYELLSGRQTEGGTGMESARLGTERERP